MTAYAALQAREFGCEADAGYRRATKHQRFVGTGYFDEVAQTIACGYSSTTALCGSTEERSSKRDREPHKTPVSTET